MSSSHPTSAQEEFRKLTCLPEDSEDEHRLSPSSSRSYSPDHSAIYPKTIRNAVVVRENTSDNDNDDDDNDEMHIIPGFGHSRSTTSKPELRLPPASFDSGHTTGVKGVIADARSYFEAARQARYPTRLPDAPRRSVLSNAPSREVRVLPHGDESAGESGTDDDESFLTQWRASRRLELESDAGSGRSIRNRRTSPSVRMFGRMDHVDAIGYLDAIEKVSRETVVVVFVYDPDCEVSCAVEAALQPLVLAHPTIRFVKVQGEEVELDNAGVPAILAYRNQGELFANLTGIIELMPDNADDGAFSPDDLLAILQQNHVL